MTKENTHNKEKIVLAVSVTSDLLHLEITQIIKHNPKF